MMGWALAILGFALNFLEVAEDKEGYVAVLSTILVVGAVICWEIDKLRYKIK